MDQSKSKGYFPVEASEIDITQPLENSLSKRRLAVFASFNKNAEIPDYVVFYLSELKKVVDGIVFIADNPLKAGEAEKIKPYAFHIHAHRHGQYDFGSYKEGIDYLTEHKFLDAAYELIICNDSCYGPFYPLSSLFQTMQKSDSDFWGITQWRGNPHPDHVQSYFMVFRKNALKSSTFKEFWEKLPSFQLRKRVVDGGEISLSQTLKRAGLKFDSFLPSDMFQSRCTNPSVYTADEAIAKGDPFVKRSIFDRDYLETCQVQLGNVTKNAMHLIKTTSDYDCSLIYKDLLKNSQQSTIHTTLNHTFFLSDKSTSGSKKTERTVAVILFAENNDIAERITPYLMHVPTASRLVIVSPHKEILNTYRKKLHDKSSFRLEVRLADKRQTAELALITTCQDICQTCDYICFINDRRTQNIRDFSIFGETLMKFSLDSLLKSDKYVANVLNLFERRAEIGILMPILPLCIPTFFQLNSIDPWLDDKVRNLGERILHRIGSNVPLDRSPIFPFSGMFWIRQGALRALDKTNWDLYRAPKAQEKLAHCLMRLWPAITQTSGYCTGEISPVEDASEIYSSLRFQLKNRSAKRPLSVNRWTLFKYRILSKYALTEKARKHYTRKLAIFSN